MTGLLLLGLLLRRRRRSGYVVLLTALTLGLTGCDEQTIVAPGGSIAVTPALTDLGSVRVGATVPFTIQVAHVTGRTVDLFDLSVVNVGGDAFAFDGFETTRVDYGETVALGLTYAPLEPGWHWANLLLTSDALQSEVTVSVRAHATLTEVDVAPFVLDFGRVDAGDSRSLELTVWNDGSGALEVEGLDTAVSGLTLTPEDGVSLVIQPFESLALPVTLASEDGEAVEAGCAVTFVGDRASDDIAVRANDCATGLPDAYDVDGDGYSSCGADCDDDREDVRPGAVETCDGIDQDCDGTIDEGTPCFDDDGDGISEDDGDCNDGAATVSPAQAEIPANGIDDDCDGFVDDETRDDDGDGYATAGGDCDDLNASVFPGAPEAPGGVADGVDNDCDTLVDEGTSAYDDDGDGASEDAGDCDDGDPATGPGATEVADWADNDCDGTIDEGTVNGDDDGDGFTPMGGDCDDTDATRSPGLPEVPGNAIDENCDGLAP